MQKIRVLVTGANGYIGSQLVFTLAENNFFIKAMVRKRNPKTQIPHIEYCVADCFSAKGLDEALANIDVAYYFVHSLKMTKDFYAMELLCAKNFAKAAKIAGVKRVIYLSGLGHERRNLSDHLASRQAVGEILRLYLNDVIEFRASAVLGAGSTSYEMISTLVTRLPIMVLPKWLLKKTQPIGIADVLFYLTQGLDLSKKLPSIIEIGGLSVLTYKDLLKAYARVRGLKRLMISVPFISLHFSSLWLTLFTPLQARVGKNLVSSLMNETIVRDKSYLQLFDHQPMDVENIIKNALNDETKEVLSPHDDHRSRFAKADRMFGYRFGHFIIKRDQTDIKSDAAKIFNVISEIGGKNGWYYLNSLWRFRAFIDRLCMGPGFSHGKSPLPLKKGNFIDCWQIEAVEHNTRILLRAIMKIPGEGYLEFELVKMEKAVRLYMTALFRPKGIIGSMYWYFIYPFHELLFKGVLMEIKKRSEIYAQT